MDKSDGMRREIGHERRKWREGVKGKEEIGAEKKIKYKKKNEKRKKKGQTVKHASSVLKMGRFFFKWKNWPEDLKRNNADLYQLCACLTSQWNLLCDMRWMKASITSIQFGGVLTGSIIGGQSGDYFGRKNTLYGSYLLHTVLNVISAYSVSWQMFTVMRFLIGVMIGKLALSCPRGWKYNWPIKGPCYDR